MTDSQLHEYIQDALEWEPSIDAADIGVSADDGVVTLRGEVKSYSERAAAERVTLGVYGVRAVANELEIRLPDGQHRTDTAIAQSVLSALKWNSQLPGERITATVSNGLVTLNGRVDWQFQRSTAENVVRDLVGVRGVVNNISVEPRVSVEDVKTKIEAALKRSAEVDARRINVAVSDGKVTLTGNVHAFFERDEARRAAWSAPGVKNVEDRLIVVP
jgi:osmotically-inducible protein OsmY